MALPLLAKIALGPLMKWAVVALGAAALIGGGVWGVMQYGAQRATVAQLRQINIDNARVAGLQLRDLRGQIAVLERASVARAARAARLAATLEAVDHAKDSRNCADSAPIRAALDGLRHATADTAGGLGADHP